MPPFFTEGFYLQHDITNEDKYSALLIFHATCKGKLC